jgi:hypothetical protein
MVSVEQMSKLMYSDHRSAMIFILTNNTTFQNHWVFGLCPSSSILKARKHNVSETGLSSILR